MESKMPELPEIEAYKKYLESCCLKKIIAQIESRDTRVIKNISFNSFRKALIGSSFTKVERAGNISLLILAPRIKS